MEQNRKMSDQKVLIQKTDKNYDNNAGISA